MISDSGFISDLQSCQRKFLLARDYMPSRWRPKSLFDRYLRMAVLASPSDDLHSNVKTAFLERCANPGLNVRGGSYAIAKEWATLLEVIVYSLPRMGLPEFRLGPIIALNSATAWKVSSLVDSVGRLHRFVTLERWNAMAVTRETHSWRTVGDAAVSGMPMVIHAIDIGRMKGDQRISDWTRGWHHPRFPNFRVRFRHRDGSSFKGWKPVRLAESRIDVEMWADTLWNEGAARLMLHTLEIESPTEAQRLSVIQDILMEVARGKKLIEDSGSIPWSALPMTRGACDGMSPCPFLDVCYGGISDPAASGLYQLRPHGGDSVFLE